jgi:16S rRNA (adenine1518-N6/adenine1519-N6)-dimethyltransferase
MESVYYLDLKRKISESGGRVTSPKILLKAWNIEPKKELGQHFLTDQALSEKIVSTSGISNTDVILEIGAGLGSLTLPAARNACRVFAVEKDPRLIALLRSELLTAGISNVRIIEKNFLNIDMAELSREAGGKLVVMGNIPYNISSQILVFLVRFREFVSRCILMFQKEPARRILSPPGSREYGRLSVMVQYCASVKALLEIPSSVFYPRVEVDSLVMEIRFKDKAPLSPENEAYLFSVVKACFGRRRKNLKNALCGSEMKITSSQAFRALRMAGIDSTRRAETLSVDDFIRLSTALAGVMSQEETRFSCFSIN